MTDALDEGRDWKKRVTFRTAMLQIAAVALLLAVGVYVVYQRGVAKQRSTESINRAREAIALDTPADLRRAVDELGPALASSTRRPDAHAVAARALAELAVVHQLESATRGAREHLSESEHGASQVEERFVAAALLYVLDGKPEEAEALLGRVEQHGGRRTEWSIAQARALIARGDGAGALAVAKKAAESASRSARLQTLLGDLSLEAGELDAADAAYRRALAANATHLGGKLGLALVELRRGRDVPAAQAAIAALLASGEASPGLAARAARVQPPSAIATDGTP